MQSAARPRARHGRADRLRPAAAAGVAAQRRAALQPHRAARADDGNYTDIAAALKLALASFPEGTGKRIVLISDGNENLGNAEEQARLAKTLKVQIDVLPLAAGKRNDDEVLVERVEAPPLIEQGARVPIRVLVRSYNPNVVVGRLTLRQITDKEGTLHRPWPVPTATMGVEVEPIDGRPRACASRGVDAGLARRPSRTGAGRGNRPGGRQGRRGTRPGWTLLLARKKAGRARSVLSPAAQPGQARRRTRPVRPATGAQPVLVRPAADRRAALVHLRGGVPAACASRTRRARCCQRGLPGDRVQNNRASTHVVARGQRRILLLENEAGAHKELVDALVEAGKGRFKVVAEPVDVLEQLPGPRQAGGLPEQLRLRHPGQRAGRAASARSSRK